MSSVRLVSRDDLNCPNGQWRGSSWEMSRSPRSMLLDAAPRRQFALADDYLLAMLGDTPDPAIAWAKLSVCSPGLMINAKMTRKHGEKWSQPMPLHRFVQTLVSETLKKSSPPGIAGSIRSSLVQESQADGVTTLRLINSSTILLPTDSARGIRAIVANESRIGTSVAMFANVCQMVPENAHNIIPVMTPTSLDTRASLEPSLMVRQVVEVSRRQQLRVRVRFAPRGLLSEISSQFLLRLFLSAKTVQREILRFPPIRRAWLRYLSATVSPRVRHGLERARLRNYWM